MTTYKNKIEIKVNAADLGFIVPTLLCLQKKRRGHKRMGHPMFFVGESEVRGGGMAD
jgi:hypothetical protein